MRRITALALAATLMSSGCASLHSTAAGVLSGGLVGAGIGAAAIAVAGGSVATGAVVGGLVGAAAGGYVGHKNEQKQQPN